MKKKVVVTLEVEGDDDDCLITDAFIKFDIEQELNCASNFYEVKSIETEIVD